MNYYKISRASDLTGKDKRLYRALEILPGFLSWGTLLALLALSYFQPVWVAYFIIAFDVYWLFRVAYLSIHLIVAYRQLKKNSKINWQKSCQSISGWQGIIHLIILPTYNESLEVIRPSILSIIQDGYPTEKMIIVFAIEERAGQEALERAKAVEKEFSDQFYDFLITSHPDGIVGELKGKGANQAWAARMVKEKIIDQQKLDYDKIIVSVFDIDTCVRPGYFSCLTHKFLTVENPHRASYQPIPVYHNNLWEAPFLARTTAISNTHWQMMQQLRSERLATYSSHSMSWRALVDIDFWSVNMVSEDSRIFWHCLCFYHGDYRVEPLYFPVSMDVCMDKTGLQTLKNLYKQQRRWGWGVENVPFVIFNFIKDKSSNFKFRRKLFYSLIQLEGFHSWATNALIIAVIGWMPMFLGGDRFNSTVLSSNLPATSRILMIFAMLGMVVSAIISTLLLPKRPKHYSFWRTITMVLQWGFLPISIIFFGAIPGIEAQTRLMLGKYMGFWVTPKSR
jgi:hypothetical protein